ncbi:MAG: AraC family transcriptional regulator [Lachnospiraceae bacterium]|nr:AraC family transcriptional regulator [Lachnospiraceae bacterium]
MEQDAYMNCVQPHPDPALSLEFCGLEHCRSGHRYGPLARSLFVIHVVLAGKGTFVHRGRQWLLGTGDMFLIAPGEETLYMADEEDPWYYGWIGFRGEQAGEILGRVGFVPDTPVLHLREPERMEEGVLELLQYPEMNAEDTLMRKGLLYQMFSNLIRLSIKPEDRRGEIEDSSYGEYALTYFQNHFREKIRIGDLADKIGISRSYLMRLVKEETGVSPKEFLIRLRMSHAVHYLLHSNMEIREVAMICGYEDALAFSKAFKGKFGMNPTEFRNIGDEGKIEELLQHFSIQITPDAM